MGCCVSHSKIHYSEWNILASIDQSDGESNVFGRNKWPLTGGGAWRPENPTRTPELQIERTAEDRKSVCLRRGQVLNAIKWEVIQG